MKHSVLRRILAGVAGSKTGALSIDETFRDAGASTPGVNFDRATWPHGANGRAKPHGAVFGTRAHSR